MLSLLKDRYGNSYGQFQALCHFLLTGTVTAFFSRFWFPGIGVAILLPLAIEGYQRLNGTTDTVDQVFDLLEHAAGGFLIGFLFWFFS